MRFSCELPDVFWIILSVGIEPWEPQANPAVNRLRLSNSDEGSVARSIQKRGQGEGAPESILGKMFTYWHFHWELSENLFRCNLKGPAVVTYFSGQILQCFSLEKSIPALLSTDTKKGQVNCLNGKFLQPKTFGLRKDVYNDDVINILK